MRNNLLKDPRHTNTVDNTVGLPNLLHGALATVLEHDVSDANSGHIGVVARVRVPRPRLDATSSHLGQELHKDAARIRALGGVNVDKDNCSAEQTRAEVPMRSAGA